jgi:hypothetical protein
MDTVKKEAGNANNAGEYGKIGRLPDREDTGGVLSGDGNPGK